MPAAQTRPNGADTEAPLLTTAEAAVALGVTVTTLNRWVRKGTLRPAMQAPGNKGARFFHPRDIEHLREHLATEDTEQQPGEAS